MKRLLFLILGALFVLPLSVVAREGGDVPVRKERKVNPKRAYEGWRLVWSDEFDGRGLDETAWGRCPRHGAAWARHMSNLDTLVKVEDGVLKLYGINRAESVNDTVPFLTGGVTSKGRRSMRMGRFDIRARFDCGRGFWPAIWIMPDANVRYPYGGEIDVMEHLNYDEKVYQTIHTPHTLQKRAPKTKSYKTTPIDPAKFNTYSVSIEKDALIFYVNGEQTFKYERLDPAVVDQFPFADHPFYVILSAQLGGSWVGEVDPADLPVCMEVDYVRFYKRR